MPESKPVRILYMEDDVGLARLLQKKLRRAGYIVDLAYDGAEGLVKYEAGAYDVVAVDQSMPVHDGLEVIRILASRGPLPPTIMITGTGNEEIAIEAMKLGAGDYIVKDTDGGYLELLPSVIEQVLYQQRLVEEKQQAMEALQQLNRNLALLNLVGQKLVATLDLQQIMELLLQAATETIGAEGGLVWLRDKTQVEKLLCRAAFHYDRHHSPLNLSSCSGQGIAGWVVQKGESLILSHAPEDPRFSPEIDQKIGFDVVSVLAIPLRVRGAVIGVLEVVNKLNGNFDTDDLGIIETLAASAAIAIDNAGLVETLRQHTTQLQARNEELDAFAHTVAHDLKSPLGPIIGLSGMLERFYSTLSDQEMQESIHIISRSSQKMSNIVDELLLLATMHETELELEPLDMESIIAEARQRLAYIVEEHKAEIIVPARWPTAMGYAPWVEEVWVNYLSNGIKYGGRPPHLELGATVQEDSTIRFWVRDNGPGLTAEEQDQLFAPFTQLSKIRARGHGLGLSIVRRIVEKLGGQVGVEGNNGQGSVFTFTLPQAATR
jgi:signal transduction histidine kinase/DNA-binding response OmpR family regulator